MGTHARSFCLGHLTNKFYRSCRRDKQKNSFPTRIGYMSSNMRGRNKHLDVYDMENLIGSQDMGIGSLSPFIGNCE